MPALGDKWRLIAPDFPGFGYTEAPDSFSYTFAGFADFLERFTERLGLSRFALYLFDFGSQAGLQLAVRHPDWIAALIIQNGDAYEETLGPKYQPLKEFWHDPSDERRAKLAEAVTFQGLREEILGEVPDHVAERISPDKDLPDAELHLHSDAGHWALETHLDEAVTLIRDFLGRVHS